MAFIAIDESLELCKAAIAVNDDADVMRLWSIVNLMPQDLLIKLVERGQDIHTATS